MDIIELLLQFGLTRQEAAIYSTLLTQGELNGYEVAKITGISRSNTYTSLATLVEKGGAFLIEGTPVRYTPMPMEELCNNKIRRLQEIKQHLMNIVPQRRDETQGYITITGKQHILNKMRNIIEGAKERIYLSVSNAILEDFLPEIRDAIQRGIKVVIITNQVFNVEGAIVYCGEKSHRQIRLIADSINVLTGDMDEGEQSSCLYSKKKNLIDLLKDSLKNEIKLMELFNENG